MRLPSALAVITALYLSLALPQPALGGTYVSFDVPGSNGSAKPFAINKWGSVTGYYVNSSGGYDGFLYQVSGTITTFSVPGASRTYALSISGTGWIAGYYDDKAGTHHGFLRNPKYTTLDVPGAGTMSGQGTQALSINDAGQISGVFWDSNAVEHGFLRDALGNYTTFDVAGGTAVVSASLNQSGEIAGTYYAPPGFTGHGYVRDAAGNITTFDVPGALDTNVAGINATGQTTGYYNVTGSPVGQFFRDAAGTITTFTVSGYLWTAGIADNGDVYGLFKASGTDKGWKRSAAGAVTNFKDPSAGSQGTFPTCVSGNGKVAGYYSDSQKVLHAFEKMN
jgi:hypothetical protein